MLVSVIPIGNSKGIRLPKNVIDECSIEDKLELEIQDKEIILKPINRVPRKGWKESLKKMHENTEDHLVIEENIDSSNFTWEW